MPAVSNPIPIELSRQRKEVFWRYVNKTVGQGLKGDCWQWKRGTTHDGYGLFMVKCMRQARTHRIAYYLATGNDPSEMLVCHTCDNPPCCNPAHLFIGDVMVNNRDMLTKGRQVAGEQQGLSKLTPEIVLQIRASYVRGVVTFRQLAQQFGVTTSNIEQILKRQTWKHI